MEIGLCSNVRKLLGPQNTKYIGETSEIYISQDKITDICRICNKIKNEKNRSVTIVFFTPLHKSTYIRHPDFDMTIRR